MNWFHGSFGNKRFDGKIRKLSLEKYFVKSIPCIIWLKNLLISRNIPSIDPDEFQYYNPTNLSYKSGSILKHIFLEQKECRKAESK